MNTPQWNKDSKSELVPYELARHSTLQQHVPTAPTLNQLSLLDNQMKMVLDDPTMPPELKLNQYYATLRRYGAIQDNSKPAPIAVRIEPPKLQQVEASSRELPVPENQILESVPKAQQRSTKVLLDHIKDNPNVEWDRSTKELMYQGKKIANSSIYDLANDFARNRKNQVPAVGHEELARALIEQNIPEAAVGNKEKWGYMKRLRGGEEEAEIANTPLSQRKRRRRQLFDPLDM